MTSAPDTYQDKISDAKLFNRNYRIKPNESGIVINSDNQNNSSFSSRMMDFYQNQHNCRHIQTSPTLLQPRKVYTRYRSII